MRGQLFRDADFAGLYCPDNGRASVAPSLLATAPLLQAHDRVSDAEAKARADFDIRWKAALGIEIEERPFAKSTLQVFRAQLILHDKVREVFDQSLRLAREQGYLKGGRGMWVALGTTYILGRGAVKDIPVRHWAEGHGYKRYVGSSVKGDAAIYWSNQRARRRLLAQIVADADRLLELARQAQEELPADGGERQGIVVDAAELLGQLLLQDMQRGGTGDDAGDDANTDADGKVSLKDGVSKDRIVSVHDPQMRHGHKSKSRRFDGHKAAIAVDIDNQLITAVDVLPGNAPDNIGVLGVLEQSEASAGVSVSEAVGGRRLRRRRHPSGFRRCRSQAGGPSAGTTQPQALPQGGLRHRPRGWYLHLSGGTGHSHHRTGRETNRQHRYDPSPADLPVCGGGVLGVSAAVPVHRGQGHEGSAGADPSLEGLLQEARALQQSSDYDQYRRRRVVAEHRLARLEQLGIRQARYFGRARPNSSCTWRPGLTSRSLRLFRAT